MKKYKVVMTKTVYLTKHIEAESEDQAEEKMWDIWNSGVKFDSDDMTLEIDEIIEEGEVK